MVEGDRSSLPPLKGEVAERSEVGEVFTVEQRGHGTPAARRRLRAGGERRGAAGRRHRSAAAIPLQRQKRCAELP